MIVATQPLLNTRETAHQLGLSKITLDQMRMRGQGPPFYKLGKAVRYSPKDLDSWLSSRRRTSTSDAI